jgi:DNA primase
VKVEELLNRKKIRYKYSGQDLLIKCLNPEHEDSNPSLRVDKVLGIFNCLACGFSGNIFKYFDESINVNDIRREKAKRKIASIRSASIGLELPEDSIPVITSYRGISPQTYAKFGAFKTSSIGMSGRIVFPIYAPDGRIVVFQGRLEFDTGEAKYYNYPRGIKLPLYPTVKPIKGRVILVEGIFDMLNLHDKGLPNAVACFGVQTVTKQALETFKLQEIDGVDIMFDPDNAGQTQATQLKKLLEDLELKPRIIKLPGDRDPGDLTPIEVAKIREKFYA